ncbi:Phage DNA invertase [Lactiplantibacillus plantarum]|uniref:recombinase family protein n=1 Tax=Lactiplantibacillus plantarum TaxID=1590 RepID=UPI0007C2C0AD|nr:recombinase family protein [Lactiplantibacillus plantarum]KZU09630.1 Phage DNA invertase [Lactiplantibacillus plantarum]WNJ67485.1 recombinase family protein [Lactiplantibacillus plantarum]
MVEVATKKIVGYIRVSTRDQAVDGYSLDVQRAQIKDYCDQHPGMVLGKIYADEGISGSTIAKRPGIRSLLSDAKAKQFDGVVVWKNSRIARNTRDLLTIIDIFQRNGVSFMSVSEKFDLDTPQGKFMLTIMGTVSELERNNIAENVYLGEYKRAQDGYANVGQVLGYDPGVDDHGRNILVVNPSEAKIIQLIFRQYDAGNGYLAIAKQLNARYRNWDKKRRNGKNDKPLLVEGRHKAIISQDLWKRVTERRKLMHRLPAWNYNGKNLLTGLLRCPECGGSMVISNTTNKLKSGTTRTRYYVCSKAKRHGGCHRNSIRADEAERLVEQKLVYVMMTPDIAKHIVNCMDQERDRLIGDVRTIISNKQHEIADVKQKLDRYDNLPSDDVELARQVKARKSMLQNNIVSLHQEIKDCERRIQSIGNLATSDTIETLLKWAYKITQADNKDYLKRVYATFIDKITFDAKKHTMKIQMCFSGSVIEQIKNYQQEAGVSQVEAPASSYIQKEIIVVV